MHYSISAGLIALLACDGVFAVPRPMAVHSYARAVAKDEVKRDEAIVQERTPDEVCPPCLASHQ